MNIKKLVVEFVTVMILVPCATPRTKRETLVRNATLVDVTSERRL